MPILFFTVFASAACANTTREVIEPSTHRRLQKRPGGKSDGHAITYDSRGRGAYLTADKLMKLCAEPPPDASANLDAKSDFSGTLKALAEHEAIKASLEGSVQRSQAASSTVADVATRTELVLFMRDALYRICEMSFNQVLTPAEARDAFNDVISAGRALGQRDNVGRLVDLARSLMAASKPDPALIHDVIGTIRFLAASDYLLTSLGKDGESGEMLATVVLRDVLGSANIADARRTLVETLKNTKEEIDAKEREIAKLSPSKKENKEPRAKLQTEIERLEAEHAQAKSTYEQLFSVPPPDEVLIKGDTGGDAIE